MGYAKTGAEAEILGCFACDAVAAALARSCRSILLQCQAALSCTVLQAKRERFWDWGEGVEQRWLTLRVQCGGGARRAVVDVERAVAWINYSIGASFVERRIIKVRLDLGIEVSS